MTAFYQEFYNILEFVKQMEVRPRDWYIEYDQKTLPIIAAQKYLELITKQVQQFLLRFCERKDQAKDFEPSEAQQFPNWLTEMAQSTMQIIQVLYNFYIVQFKLSKIPAIKDQFKLLYEFFKLELDYCMFFFTRTFQFRLNRVVSSMLRVNGFMRGLIIDKKQNASFRKQMDKTFLDNVDEVYLFINQRTMQSLQVTKILGNHEINLLLMDRVAFLMRIDNDPTIKGVLDVRKQKQIIDKILKANLIESQFKKQKQLSWKKFEQNKYFEIEMPVEEDPNLEKNIQPLEEEDGSHSSDRQ